MRIVHVFHNYYPVLGGIERAIQRLAEELVKLGHEVHVITSIHGAEDRPREETLNDVSIHRVRSWRLHYPDLTIPREIPRNILKGADIVHGWSQNSYFTYRICKESKKLGKPTIMYFLGVDYIKHHYNPLIRVFGYQYQKLIARKVTKIMDLALVTNEYEKELLKERYGIDAIVLAHGVDEAYLKLPNMAEHFRKRYGIESRIIAYIGRIHPTKGLDLLIKAFAEVTKQMPDAVLVIAGKGDENYLKKCMKLAEKLGIKNKIRYLGYIPEEDKITLIDAADIVVLPTRHAGESHPLLIDEVLARGKTTIVTDRSKILERRIKYGDENRNIVVSPSNSVSLARTITSLLENEKLVFTVNGPRNKMQMLSWSNIARRLVELYNQVI
ncbi:MAG: glycosyltransferase family 1 protein [Thermoprotei archaeon]|nr:MAG: glycosyltransferase family 1 protein [Thermoprotei archaeon]